MKKLYEVTSLDSSDIAIDRFEVLAADMSAAYEMAVTIFQGGLPATLWIGPSDQDWYVTFKNTEKNVLTNNVVDASFACVSGSLGLQN